VTVFEQMLLIGLVVTAWQVRDDRRHRRQLRRPLSDLRWAYSEDQL
jgi:hypothetical protein